MGFGKDGTGSIIRENRATALGALAADAAIKMTGLTLAEDFRILRSDVFAHVDILTAGEGQGLLFGIANGELTAVEIAECLNDNGPSDRNDRALHETASRNVKVLSSAILIDSGGVSRHFVGDQGGPMITSKHRWTYSDPEGWAFFVYNDGPTLTTGSICRYQATQFGVWVT